VVRAKQKKYIPVVLSRDEIDSILEHLPYPYDLVVNSSMGVGFDFLNVCNCALAI
jgi:hypothetical protein